MSHFRLPDLLLKLRCETPRKLYSLAWSLSDDQGIFTMTPAAFSSFASSTRRRWVARFVKWKLWEVIEPGRGRGKHPIYCIRGKAKFVAKEAHNKIAHEAKDKKNIKPPFGTPRDEHKNSQRLQWLSDRNKRWVYSFEGWTVLRQGEYGYHKLARCLRLCFWDLGAPREANDALTGIVMNKLEDQTAGECQRVCFALLRWIASQRKKFQRLLECGRRIFSWVAWLLLKFIQGENPDIQPKRAQSRHGERCECSDCERERVGRRRTEYERTLPKSTMADKWQRWAQQRLADLAWRQKQAELVRQRLCEQRRHSE
ncbi:hypothetical protein HYR54_10885 [Candidatus Acetothermia bacterium]|nr:hypothetical protein [Candidatus Acetothermia bacterium]